MSPVAEFNVWCDLDATRVVIQSEAKLTMLPMELTGLIPMNDAIFTKVLNYDWHKMNNTGSPLVFGHPQGPTLTRVLMEALEEAVELGGGYVLIFGCAAGDVGIAAIFHVQ